MMKFADFFADGNLLDIGNTCQLVGAVYAGGGDVYLMLFPGEELPDDTVPYILDMSPGDWKACLHQSDGVAVLVTDPDGVRKAIVRKCERNIDSVLSWRIFARDGFRCRYCGRGDLPLTVDHLIVWEDGGPTIDQNLVAACKKCNRKRGNMPYAEWLASPAYAQLSAGLDEAVKIANIQLATTLNSIVRVSHIRSR